MPDVAGESKAAAEKAAKAAKEAADLAAQKTKETYDLVIPAEIDWSRTWWPQPMKDGIHALQNGVGKSVNFVADTATSGVSMAGNMASSGVSMVGQGASGMSFTPRAGAGAGAWMPMGSSGNLETRTKDEIVVWLEANSLSNLKDAFLKAEVDGASMVGLIESWKKDPIGFATYAETHLGCKGAGDSMKLGAAINKVYSFQWPVKETPQAAPAAPQAAPAPAAESAATGV
jgi:hypothetical protein